MKLFYFARTGWAFEVLGPELARKLIRDAYRVIRRRKAKKNEK